MRLLFLTNFYPPASRGGYEQWCQEVTEGLRDRGHEVLVLTSRHGRVRVGEAEPTWIRRDLHLEMELVSFRNGLQFFTRRKQRENENLARLRQLVQDFVPDSILVWGMWNLPRSLAAAAESLVPGRVAYYIADYWPTLPSQYALYWEAPPRHRWTAMPKRLLRPVARRMLAREERPELSFASALFPTAFMRDELRRRGISPQASEIISGAIDTSLYPFRDSSSRTQQGGFFSLLYVGRLTPEKGVHTAIEALGILVHRHGLHHLHLTIIGAEDPDYEAHLRQLVQQEKVERLVTFLGAQRQDAMPAIFGQADVLLFTSIWPEPFGRVLIEAMASGVVVVGTATGGAGEILADNENALIFAAGDATGLAVQVARLIESPALRQRLTQAARQSAVDRFDIHRMTREIEDHLENLAGEA